ncbi:MAG: hypothetical protein DME97_01680 [Verrucomicrobia bacterium]|nr:MAG: hypothetical protein DME97_01680 [Verrucomicrobiota bacterium]
MKIIIVAITSLIAAAATPFVLAQEDSPSPAASPEATASDPSVSVTTEKTASPAPKSEASASPSKSSSPAATKSSPSATPSASSSPAAVMPTKKSTPEAQAYLADDFRGVSSKGKVMSKSNLLSEIKKDTDTYTSTKNGKVEVRVFGGQFAIALGTSIEAGKAKDGQAFKRTFRWTDVWVLRKDKWQCVASQAMLVK